MSDSPSLRDQSRTEHRVIVNPDQTAGYAARIPVRQQHGGTGGEYTDGVLPMWMGIDGKLHIAVQTHEPRFAHDFDQIIVEPHELMLGLALAFERRP